MKVSVLVPAYNCTATIRATLDSVLHQTKPADEILVMNDGSTDQTESVLKSYEPRIKVFSQPNSGLARTRNALIQRAEGDLIAFLDSDDLWHPKYLEEQRKLFEKYPNAAALFMGHLDFRGAGDFQWRTDPGDACSASEVLTALEFFERYNKKTGFFACFSYCCIPMRVLKKLGNEPFKEQGCEDSYCCSLLALLGEPVVYSSAPFAAYRMRDDSMSANHVLTFGIWVYVFELLETIYRERATPDLWNAFRLAFASKRRSYAKLLLGAGKYEEARQQLRRSLHSSRNPMSLAKSIAILSLSYMPTAFQPTWPSGLR